MTTNAVFPPTPIKPISGIQTGIFTLMRIILFRPHETELREYRGYNPGGVTFSCGEGYRHLPDRLLSAIELLSLPCRGFRFNQEYHSIFEKLR